MYCQRLFRPNGLAPATHPKHAGNRFSTPWKHPSMIPQAKSVSGCIRGEVGFSRLEQDAIRSNGRREAGRIKCMADPSPSKSTGTGRIIRIPVFPLGMVTLPATTVPLHIFEARYRVLFSTLLAGDPGVEEDLIQQDSPFLGSRKFGATMSINGKLAATGTILEIKQFIRLDSGKLLVTCKGTERFSILQVAQEVPVLLCDVEILKDSEESNPAKVAELTEELVELYRNLAKLNKKTSKNPQSPEVLEPEELSTLSSSDMSFWIVSLFEKNELQQQQLLEESSVRKRLEREVEIMQGAVSYLSAKSALKSLGSDGDDGQGSSPQGGPD